MAEHGSACHRSIALLDHLARLGRAHGESTLAALGLRPRHLIALTMLRDQGAMTQQALAAKLHVDRTNLVGLLNDLESDDLVARTRSTEDRRRHLVELTAAGARRLNDAETALEASEDVVLRGLDARERETLYRLLQRAAADTDAGAAATG